MPNNSCYICYNDYNRNTSTKIKKKVIAVLIKVHEINVFISANNIFLMYLYIKEFVFIEFFI